MVKLMIGIPNQGEVKFGTMMSIFGAINALGNSVDVLMFGETGSLVPWSRNDMFEFARLNGQTHLLFIDTDMDFPADTIQKLLALNAPVVGVNSFKKGFPKQTTVHVLDQNGEGHWSGRNAKNGEVPAETFKEIDGKRIGVGTGIMLIDMEMTKDIPPPWFVAIWPKQGEDVWFCSKVLQAGFEVWCDPTIDVGHLGDYKY